MDDSKWDSPEECAAIASSAALKEFFKAPPLYS